MLASLSGTKGAAETADFRDAGEVFAAESSPLDCLGTLACTEACAAAGLVCGAAAGFCSAGACAFGCDMGGAGGVIITGAVVVTLCGSGWLGSDAIVDCAYV